MTTPHEVGLLRLVAQGLVGAPPARPAVAAVRLLTAVQAQDLPGALVSVALRTGSRSLAAVVAGLQDGSMVRTWPMRGTLHLLAATDARWLLRTTAPRSVHQSAARRAELGLDAPTLERAHEVADRALAAAATHGLRRSELLQTWQDAGISTASQRGYHLMSHLAQTGLLCLGPMPDAEQRLVRLDDHVPTGPDLTGDEALAELAVRYLHGHGPATVHDLARWSGLTVRDARTGLALGRPQLQAIDVDGTEHWLDPGTPDRLAACRAEASDVLLLPGFDEYLLGYGDRSAVLAHGHLQQVVPGGNGVFRPTVVDAGRVVGTWRHVGRGEDRTVEAIPFETFRPTVAAALTGVHGRLPR